jgi:succinate dehydrogenase / fumarate reductase flavoprotein subunit
VFGRESGQRAAEYARGIDYTPLPKDVTGFVEQQLEALHSGDGNEKAVDIRREMQEVMFEHVGVFRVEEGMKTAVDKVRELKERFVNVRVDDHGRIFNTDVLEAWELGCLLDLAEVTAVSALERKESRGAHAREDFSKRDDKNWMQHTLAELTPKGVALRYKPVTVTRFEPKERVY